MIKSNVLLLLVAVVMLFASCKKDDEVPSYDFSVELKYPADYAHQAVAGLNVEIINTTTQNKNTYTSNEQGIVSFTGVTDGVYNIQGSLELTADEAFRLVAIKQPISVNISLLDFRVDANMKATTSVEVNCAQKSSLLISEIYASPSAFNSLTEMFIEIYNNSDEQIALDGKYIAVMGGPSNDGFGEPFDINGDKLYFESLVQIPGTGNEYILQPKSFFVIAANAKQFDYLPEGASEMVVSVDLSNADMEVHSLDYNNERGLDTGSLGGVMYYDTDNPSVPNIDLKYLTTANWWFFAPGYTSSVLLFDAEQPIQTEVYKESYNQAHTLNKKDIEVIDAVDYLVNGQAAAYKNFPTSLDAGFIFLSGENNVYKRKSVSRKKSTDTAGGLVFVDTNNSSNDFEEVDPNPAK